MNHRQNRTSWYTLSISAHRDQLSIAMIPASTSRDARRLAFVEAAERAFFQNGYAGTTMSSIAAIVGGSKSTLWSYFPSKQALFEAVLDRLGEQYGKALAAPLDPELPLEAALRQMATDMLAAILSEPPIALMRLVTGEAGRFPELARAFFERGPKRGRAKLATYFRAAMARGEMRKGDPTQAAALFGGLCQSGVYQQTLLGLMDKPSARAMNADIEAAIVTFTGSWGTLRAS